MYFSLASAPAALVLADSNDAANDSTPTQVHGRYAGRAGRRSLQPSDSAVFEKINYEQGFTL